jgi:K+-transporting ATPase KdpF subunit
MNLTTAVILIVTVVLAGYLVATLLYAEKF